MPDTLFVVPVFALLMLLPLPAPPPVLLPPEMLLVDRVLKSLIVKPCTSPANRCAQRRFIDCAIVSFLLW